MKFYSRSGYEGQRLAATQVFNLMDDQLIVILRSWGSADYNQKFIDDVVHYLSSTQADLDVTTPFEYQESLSSLANRTRVSLLLGHDSFYRNENKNEFLVGFEATVLLKSKNELAWSSVGRFSIDKVVDKTLQTYMKNGSDLDIEVLLPVQLLGIGQDVSISSGSMLINDDTQIVLSSLYKSDLCIGQGDNLQSLIDVRSVAGTYWYSVISPAS
ncbi:MAG: hypothetical protein AABY53_03865 [Bdellovibrionota bacterium]